MTKTLIELNQLVPEPGHSVLLRQVSWQQFEDILVELGDGRSSRVAYDKGSLEIMVPTPEHEYFKTNIGSLIEDLADELEQDYENFGSTTWKKQDVLAGVEPDECFYIQNFSAIQGKININLNQGDPPPDLVLEIDFTSKSLNSLPIYAKLGVPEVWLYDQGELYIYHLEDDVYVQAEASLAFPNFPAKELPNFVKQHMAQGRRLLRQSFRVWLRQIKA